MLILNSYQPSLFLRPSLFLIKLNNYLQNHYVFRPYISEHQVDDRQPKHSYFDLYFYNYIYI